ncbi:nucleolar protein [Malassezia sp. CBS 17886]|nr:nucleolar protein [Malassezia sp. CBS 17886]
MDAAPRKPAGAPGVGPVKRAAKVGNAPVKAVRKVGAATAEAAAKIGALSGAKRGSAGSARTIGAGPVKSASGAGAAGAKGGEAKTGGAKAGGAKATSPSTAPPRPRKTVRVVAPEEMQPKKRKADVDAGEHLHGFPPLEGDSDEEDEEDDALANRAAPTVDEVVRLPSSRDDKVVRQRLDQVKRRQAQRQEETEPGVVYVGRLPHGFFEEQLRAYFSQFGDIRRLRLSRNKKTGHSKHYGFIEFASLEVAEIVVETMNNYLIDGHLLQLASVPQDEVDPNLWIGANRTYRRIPTDRIERVRRASAQTPEARHRVNARLLQREKKRRAALAASGIEYDFPGYQA